MKLFQTVQNNLASLGYVRDHNGYRYYPFSGRHFRTTLLFSSGTFSILMFLIHIANSPGEYIDSFFTFTASFSIFICHMTTSFKMMEFFAFFDGCGKVYDESKFNFIEIFKETS